MAAVGAVAGVPAPADAATGWSSEPVDSSAADGQDCADFLFVGVRGSGEPSGYGPTITGVRDGLKKRWTSTGSVRQVWLDYPAVPPQTLADVPFESLLFDQPFPATKYFDSAKVGAARLVEVMDDSLERCPREHLLLAGFSQGAQVITSALATTRPGARLTAAILLGNPSHYPGQNVRELEGSASASAIGMGAYLYRMRDIGRAAPNRQTAVESMLQESFDLTENKVDQAAISAAMVANHAEIPPEAYASTYSVCRAGDMVCDSAQAMGQLLVQASTMRAEIDRTRPVHLGYTGAVIARTLDAVGTAAGAVDVSAPSSPAVSPGASSTPTVGTVARPVEPTTGRPSWVTTAGIGLGALVLGYVVGILRGRAHERVSRRGSRRRRGDASS